jgi:hypothetical protein
MNSPDTGNMPQAFATVLFPDYGDFSPIIERALIIRFGEKRLEAAGHLAIQEIQ